MLLPDFQCRAERLRNVYGGALWLEHDSAEYFPVKHQRICGLLEQLIK